MGLPRVLPLGMRSSCRWPGGPGHVPRLMAAVVAVARLLGPGMPRGEWEGKTGRAPGGSSE
jgi:hypothetical protein